MMKVWVIQDEEGCTIRVVNCSREEVIQIISQTCWLQEPNIAFSRPNYIRWSNGVTASHYQVTDDKSPLF